MHVLDASSILSAWDTYPPDQFPGLWDWLEELAQKKELVIAEVALEEVKHKYPECAAWLKDCEMRVLPVTSAMTGAAGVKRLLGIVDDGFHPHGVGENDLLIIATAKVHGGELISDEFKQPSLPKDRRRYKIPAVCGLAEVNVPCMNFREFMIESKRVFR